MTEITERNYHDEESAFVRRNGGGKATPCTTYVMARPDRPTDPVAHRYRDDAERARGDKAMAAWFEYLAEKGFIRIFRNLRSLLKSGRSIMFVHDDPGALDMAYVPRGRAALGADFWAYWERARGPEARP